MDLIFIHCPRQGGQTIPTKSQKSGAGLPPVSRTINLRLPIAVSETIVRNCRSLGITFGNALPILSQIAHARVLHRRRFPSDASDPAIGDEEWAFRRIQPTHFGGPLNLRPYLERSWYERGGAEEVLLAISFFFLELPFLPTFLRRPTLDVTSQTSMRGSASDLLTGDPNEFDTDSSAVHCPPIRAHSMPPFFSFLSPQRFLHRAMIVRLQNAHTVRHALLHELHLVRTFDRIRRARAAGLAWRRRLQQTHSSMLEETPSTYNHSSCVFANGGASLGNVSRYYFWCCQRCSNHKREM